MKRLRSSHDHGTTALRKNSDLFGYRDDIARLVRPDCRVRLDTGISRHSSLPHVSLPPKRHTEPHTGSKNRIPHATLAGTADPTNNTRDFYPRRLLLRGPIVIEHIGQLGKAVFWAVRLPHLHHHHCNRAGSMGEERRQRKSDGHGAAVCLVKEHGVGVCALVDEVAQLCGSAIWFTTLSLQANFATLVTHLVAICLLKIQHLEEGAFAIRCKHLSSRKAGRPPFRGRSNACLKCRAPMLNSGTVGDEVGGICKNGIYTRGPNEPD